MKWAILLLTISVLLLSGVEDVSVDAKYLKAFTDELIRYVNEESGALWKAAPSQRFRNVEEFKRLLGARHEGPALRNARRMTISHNVDTNALPESFDAREKWPNCTTIGEIRDQSNCGSCWAFGAVEAMSDRLCIHSFGRVNVELSARDLLSCCNECGDGCQGGWPGMAFDYWKNVGIVTGGSMEQPSGCQPYPFPSCTHRGKGKRPKCPKKIYPTPTCLTECQATYPKTYEEDKYFASTSYNVRKHEQDIMYELLTNGPLEVAFRVYEDFGNYKEGIYHHVAGEHKGDHAVRLLGWGVENGTKYWRLANSWNEDWGEKGFFRIVRGKNECGIESEAVAGLPLQTV
ncbi:hypothetical protein P879_07808 [Paragonimus westermani]|uniref:Cathepsin B-like cysteine proteinase n=1 Tax=Paragonimus westermani TaxID=34504 RepID=A0A8T0D9Q5_9TREM|nr:hypothetical protein P879_07808 [Paragonimus westermani]